MNLDLYEETLKNKGVGLNWLLLDKKINLIVTLSSCLSIYILTESKYVTISVSLFLLMIVNSIHTILRNQVEIDERIYRIDRQLSIVEENSYAKYTNDSLYKIRDDLISIRSDVELIRKRNQ